VAGETIIELLVKAGILDDRQHDNVMSRAKGAAGGHLVQEMNELGYATESTVARVLSVELGLPRIDLHATPAEPDAIQLLDAKTCIEKFVLPVALREGGELLWLAMGDPTDSAAMAYVRRITGKRVRPVVAGPTEIVREARRIYNKPQSLPNETQFDRDNNNSIELNEAGEERFEVVNIADESADPSSVGFSSQPGSIPGPMLDEATLAAADNERKDQEERGRQVAEETKADSDLLDAAIRAQIALEELFRVPVRAGLTATNDLTAEDLASLDAVRGSMEKGALVLRALAELCVEKGLFTREEMGKKNRVGVDSQRGKTSPGKPI
jgi:hypothetical protein